MSKRIRTQTKPFSSWTAGDAALMSSRKFKSRSKDDIAMQNLNYRELAKSMKTPVSNPESSKVIPNKKVKPVKNAKPGKKDRSCGKKKAKSVVSAPIKMNFNKK